ncbi:MAG: glycoside hydrolase family 28 protein [Bacteroidota bacterium]
MKYIFTSIIALLFSVAVSAQEKNIAYYTAKAPFKMPVVPLPTFSDKVFSIKDYGGVGDGKTLNTEAFAKAIDACTKAGGGKVVVPAGKWITGPIELKSNVNLYTEKNALVQFTPDRTQYPIINMSGDGKTFVPASPVYAYKADNIAISGEGAFDGAGESWRPVKKNKVTAVAWDELKKSGGVVSEDGKIWWPTYDAMNGEEYVKALKDKKDVKAEDYLRARDFLRPYMVFFIQCKTILVEGVTLRNSPKFVFYPSRCTDLTINGVSVFNEWWAQNGDGIDISACKNVVIYNTALSVGDDGICMKSSRGSKAAGEAQLQNILIANCVVYRAHGGFVIGSNTDGGMQNIYVVDCDFEGSDIGIRVKSNPGRGGLVKDIYIDNIRMKNIKEEAILFTTYYEDMPAGKTAANNNGGEAVDDKIPHFTNFHISNVLCEGAETAISFTGLPGTPVDSIYMENMNITAKKGFVSTDAKDIFMNKVTLNAAPPLFKLKSSSNVLLDGKPVTE